MSYRRTSAAWCARALTETYQRAARSSTNGASGRANGSGKRIGEVDGGTCVLVDDIVDSGGTLVNAADALLEKGAKAVYAYITHGVLSGGAVARVNKSNLKELVITNSIQPTDAVTASHNIRVLSIATLIGEAISRTAAESRCRACFSTKGFGNSLFCKTWRLAHGDSARIWSLACLASEAACGPWNDSFPADFELDGRRVDPKPAATAMMVSSNK